jgi:hypothetical protein
MAGAPRSGTLWRPLGQLPLGCAGYFHVERSAELVRPNAGAEILALSTGTAFPEHLDGSIQHPLLALRQAVAGLPLCEFTTLTKLRTARRDWQDDRTRHARGLDPATTFVRVPLAAVDDLGELDPEEDTVLVIGHWSFAGRGHTTGEAIFAATVARDQAENRHIYRQMKAGHPDWENAA